MKGTPRRHGPAGPGPGRVDHRLHRRRRGRRSTVDEVNGAFAAAAAGAPLARVLDYTEDPIVSSDIVGSPASCTFDAGLTMVQPVDDQPPWSRSGLVRQRVGLLQPAGRPGRRRRRAGVTGGAGVTGRGLPLRGAPPPRGPPRGRRPTRPGAHRLQRPARRRTPTDGRTVADDFRIRAALPTLDWLLERGAGGHRLQPPRAGPRAPDARCDMAPVRDRLAELCPGGRAAWRTCGSPRGRRRNDPAFVDRAGRRASTATSTRPSGSSHRRHASVVGPPTPPAQRGRAPPGPGGRGPGRLLDDPARPFVAVVGGAKVADKLGRARGPGRQGRRPGRRRGHGLHLPGRPGPRASGSSLVELDRVEDCRQLLDLGSRRSCCRPTSVALEPGGTFGPRRRAGPRATPRSSAATCPTAGRGLDIGPETAERLRRGHRRGRHGAVERPARAWSRTTASPPGPTAVARAVADCARLHRGRRRRQRRRPRRTWAWPTGSTSSRPAAGRRWSSSSTATCPGSLRACAERPRRATAAGPPRPAPDDVDRAPRAAAAPWSAATGRCTTTTSRRCTPSATSGSA